MSTTTLPDWHEPIPPPDSRVWLHRRDAPTWEFAPNLLIVSGGRIHVYSHITKHDTWYFIVCGFPGMGCEPNGFELVRHVFDVYRNTLTGIEFCTKKLRATHLEFSDGSEYVFPEEVEWRSKHSTLVV